jgi:thiamine biosynthesis lipoprotein
MKRIGVLGTVLVLLGALSVLTGCGGDEPVVVSREALGTVVTVTAYGEDEAAVTAAIESAYAAMAAVEAQIDAYDAASMISQFNANPYTPAVLPAEANVILNEVSVLGVGADFSPSLLGVERLYDFEGSPHIPDSDDLVLAVAAAGTFRRNPDGTAEFMRGDNPDARLDAGGALAPGIDLGGAAKGLAMDRARDALKASGAVTAALISSGSSTVTFGAKPDGGAWVIGIEDPRDPEEVVATFTFEGDGALSTSGDYQRYFEADGRRYHHILHPSTGRPAEGLRSLTVAGTSLTGLHTDILSTALFVMGPDEAQEWATDHGVALYAVDTEGRALVVPAPEESGLTVAEKADPQP